MSLARDSILIPMNNNYLRTMKTTRLAPSPTGALHLGNARTFLVNWLTARQNGWRVVLRIDDLDGPRIKRGADRMAMEDLAWLGIDWDEGPVYQSARLERYGEAIDRLMGTGRVYRCYCSRKEIERSASAPHASDGATVYPGTCRPVGSGGIDIYSPPLVAGSLTSNSVDSESQSCPGTSAGLNKSFALRFTVPDESFTFIDDFSGEHTFDLPRQLGDFVIAKSDLSPSYQLAVVVDDVDAGITDVIRGDDLLDSTPRQILLYRALGWAKRIPRYCHLPLILGQDGLRLAKRHGDTRLGHYREQDISAGRVLQLLARWCGIDAPGSIHCAGDLLGRLDLGRLAKKPIVYTNDDDLWLRDAIR